MLEAMNVQERIWRWIYDGFSPLFEPVLSFCNRLLGYSDAEERRKLVAALDLQPGQQVLEVGVGTGRNLPWLRQAVTETGSVLGADFSRGMLLQCRRRHAGRAHLLQAEAERLPFADGSFDAVLHYGAVNIFANVPAAIAEMARVTRPGGRLVLSDQGTREELRHGLRFAVASRIIPFLRRHPPLQQLPDGVTVRHLDWLWRGDCYLLVLERTPEPVSAGAAHSRR